MSFDPVLLFGRLHPLVLHFPIAFLLAGAAVEAFRAWRPQPWLDRAGLLLLGLGAASAVIAAAMGFTLAVVDDHQGPTVDWHRAFGITVAVTAVIAFALRLRGLPAPLTRAQPALYGGTLATCVAAVFMAGHYGGALTHGPAFLDEAMPRFGVERAHAAMATDVFATDVQPILEEHCISCHGAEKQRGGLRLDVREAALKGGESGSPSIVPGSIAESEMVRRLFLPREDEKAMPPDGRERPTAEELVVLLDWVQAGAAFEGGAAGPAPLTEDLLAEGLEPISPEQIAALEAQGLRVRRLSLDNALLDVTAPNAEALAAIAPVADQVAWLTLHDAAITGDEAKAIGAMPRLTRLDLTGVTGLSPAAVGRIAKAKALETVILAGSDVDAQAAQRLGGARALQAVYLHGAGLDDREAERLQKRLRGARVVVNAELAAPSAEVSEAPATAPPPQ